MPPVYYEDVKVGNYVFEIIQIKSVIYWVFHNGSYMSFLLFFFYWQQYIITVAD